MNIKISAAIRSLVPNAVFSIENDSYDTISWDEVNTSEMPSKEQILREQQRLESEWQKNEYQRLRRPEYPSIEEQFDMLYHLGYDGWKVEINKIKDKYPKPE